MVITKDCIYCGIKYTGDPIYCIACVHSETGYIQSIIEDLGNGWFLVEVGDKFVERHRSVIEDSLVICFKSKERMNRTLERSRS